MFRLDLTTFFHSCHSSSLIGCFGSTSLALLYLGLFITHYLPPPPQLSHLGPTEADLALFIAHLSPALQSFNTVTLPLDLRRLTSRLWVLLCFHPSYIVTGLGRTLNLRPLAPLLTRRLTTPY